MSKYIARVDRTNKEEFEMYLTREQIKFELQNEPFSIVYLLTMDDTSATVLKLTMPLMRMMRYTEVIPSGKHYQIYINKEPHEIHI